MRVLLVDIDSRMPNLALKKLREYHRKDIVEFASVKFFMRPREWTDALVNRELKNIMPYASSADKVYVSCLFEHNRSLAAAFEKFKHAVIGGPGYDLNIKLPPEVSRIIPRISFGYTSRGCNRNCSFCIVPKIEGKAHPVADIGDLWDNKSNSVGLLDNNILCLPDHFWKIARQLKERDLALDMMQGFDIRLVNEETCKIFETLKFHNSLKFAFDDPKLFPIVKEKLELLRRYDLPRRLFFYVLVGYNSTYEEDVARAKWLVAQGCNPFIMKYKSVHFVKKYQDLASWCNMSWPKEKYTFEGWIDHNKKGVKRNGDTKNNKVRKRSLCRNSKSFPFSS